VSLIKKMRCFFVFLLIPFGCKEAVEPKSNTSSFKETTSAGYEFHEGRVKNACVLQGVSYHVKFGPHEFSNRFTLFMHRIKAKEKKLRIHEARREIEASLNQQGLQLIALINGGYFDEKNVVPLSYYRASRQGSEHIANNAPGGSVRPCLVYNPQSLKGAFEIADSDEKKYREMRTLQNAEIMCAGPQLIKDNEILPAYENSLKNGKFSPEWRPNKDDPLKLTHKVPRAGSCIGSDGSFHLFMQHDRVYCGPTMADFAAVMKEAQCRDGINHDGGGSVAMFVRSPNGKEYTFTGIKHEPVPVWLVIAEKVSK
jgi:hypothetical protein